MIPFSTLCVILGTNPPAQTTIVVGAGDSPVLASHIARRATAETEQGRRVLGQEEILLALLDLPAGQPADIDGLRNMLTEAHQLEAYYDTDGARGLRDSVLKAYERSRRPSAALLQVAAAALQGIAGNYIADGDQDQAFHWAQQAGRRFPGVAVDSQRYAPPTVAMFKRAAEALDTGPSGRLKVTLSEPGELFVDGRSLGVVETTGEQTLPAGRYVLRVVSDAGWSFPHLIEVKAGGQVELAVDFAFERCVEVVPRLTLVCSDQWEDHLQTLMTASGADRAVGIIAAGDSQEVREVVLPRPAEDSRFARFSPLYLVPFGGGQFTQRRHTFGAAYATATVGLVAWQVVSRVRFSRVNDGLQMDAARSASLQINLSFWLLAGTVAVTVAEALIVGWLYGGTDFR